MIVRKEYTLTIARLKILPTDEGNTKWHIVGWYLFGSIPLFIRETQVI